MLLRVYLSATNVCLLSVVCGTAVGDLSNLEQSNADYVLGFFQHALHLILIHYVSLANSMLTSLTRYGVAVYLPPHSTTHTHVFTVQ